MPALSRSNLSKVFETLLTTGAWKATLYLSHNEVVRATRIWRRHRKTQSVKPIEVRLTVGRPNFAERKFVKACQQASQSFPVRKVQLKFRHYRKQ